MKRRLSHGLVPVVAVATLFGAAWAVAATSTAAPGDRPHPPATQPAPDPTAEAAARLLAVVADPDADWQDRDAAERDLAALPPEQVLPLLVPAMRDRPAGEFYPGAGSADADKDAPPEWQAYYAVRRAWDAQVDRAVKDDADLGPTLADLLLVAKTGDARRSVAGAMYIWWADRAEPTLSGWFRNRDQPADVRQVAASVLLHRQPQRGRYYPEVRGLADGAAEPLKGLLFEVLIQCQPAQEPDPAVVVMGFDLMEQACRGPGDRAGAEYARRLGRYVRVDFTPDEKDPTYRAGGPDGEPFARDTVANARRWWAEHGRDVGKGAEKVKPGPV